MRIIVMRIVGELVDRMKASLGLIATSRTIIKGITINESLIIIIKRRIIIITTTRARINTTKDMKSRVIIEFRRLTRTGMTMGLDRAEVVVLGRMAAIVIKLMGRIDITSL